MLRCYRVHAENDPVLGQPIESAKRVRQPASTDRAAALPPGLEPKTVVNTHRMLHRAWSDFEVWGWAKRNVVSDAHPPRVPRKGRKVWAVGQLQTFLRRSRQDRFFALWVLEATSGMRRQDRLEGALQAHRACRRCVHHEAVRTDRPRSRPRGCEHAR